MFKLFIFFTSILIFYSCSSPSGPRPPNPSNPLKGVYILYENSANFVDLAFYDVINDTVINFLYMSRNPGKVLNKFAGELKYNADRNLYFTAVGTANNNGTIYKMNPDSYAIIDSLRFGNNPFGFAINNNRMIVSHLSSNYCTFMDTDFNIIQDNIPAGPSPAKVLYAYSNFIVNKIFNSAENSLAFIYEQNLNVFKLYFPSVPVGSVFNPSGIFTITAYNKIVYRIDPKNFFIIDSLSIPTIQSYLSHIIFKSQTSFYVIAGNKEVWLISNETGVYNINLIFNSSADVSIINAAYEQNSNQLYIADGNNLSENGEVLIINGQTGTVIKTKQLGGKNPSAIAFRY